MGNWIVRLTREGEEAREIELKKSSTLGRGENCDIQLISQSVSRVHAELKVLDEGVRIEKRSQFSVIKLNGSDVSTALFRVGDSMEVGPYRLELIELREVNRSIVEDSKKKAGIDDGLEPMNSEGESRSGIDEIPSIAEPSVEGDVLIEGQDGVESHSKLTPPAFSKNLSSSADFSFESDEEISGGEPDNSGEVKIQLDPPEQSTDPLEVETAEIPVEVVDPLSVDSQSSFSEEPLVDDPSLNLHSKVSGLQKGEGLAHSQNDSSSLGVEKDDFPKVAEETGDTLRTQVNSSDNLSVRVILPVGAAHTTDYEMLKDEISIGRGKKCDIVLHDKKSSRKHVTIRRSGLNFFIKDHESANGTYVNNVKIQEKELTGDDEIKIGDTSFRFHVSKKEEGLKQGLDLSRSFLSSDSLSDSSRTTASQKVSTGSIGDPLELQSVDRILTGSSDISLKTSSSVLQHRPTETLYGLPNVENAGSAPQSLREKIRNSKYRKPVLYGVVLVVSAWFLFGDNISLEFQKKRVPASASKAKNNSKDFEGLSPKDKTFVKNQYALALDLYTNKEYDKAVFEIRKIFKYVENYEDARDIERYALEGKRRLEKISEENRQKREESERKTKVAKLTKQIQVLMKKKSYKEAGRLFVQVLALDPENSNIARWQRTIDEYNSKKEREEREKRVQAEINQNGQLAYDRALKLKKKGDCLKAIQGFSKISDIGVSDSSLLDRAKERILECRASIDSRIKPLISQAKSQEEQGEGAKAYKTYKEVTLLDPGNEVALDGMDRIKGVLHERAKYVYTEAVLAESYSDFETAKLKYEECLRIAPKGDIYYARAKRKLSRFSIIRESSSE